MRVSRRSFLQATLVTASAVPFTAGCSDGDEGQQKQPAWFGFYSTDPADTLRVFPQGVASGDPKPDSVILWTRAVPDSGSGDVVVAYQIALDEEFTEVVASGRETTNESTDWTVRIKLVGLNPYTQYYYRFGAERVQSDIGRTKTAPSADQDVNVRFAFASCQDYIGRYYHSWQALLETEDPVDFVVFLGDYIYETNGDSDFQLTGGERQIEIPDGIEIEPGSPPVKAAKTLADYRGLYKQYRSDETLKKVHRLYPFISIWDDHEFANDAWQDHATDFNEAKGDEKSTARREAANQAWFEYQLADVEWNADANFPDDLKIYRTLRYGKHMELVLTDQRSYRSDHAIPEKATGAERPAGAPDTVPTYAEAGKLSKNAAIGSRNFVRKSGFDGIEAYVKPTMLGAEQKQWLLDTVKGSDATWKIWGNETQLLEMLIDLSPFPVPSLFQGIYYFTVDQWDGFRTERMEVLKALEGVKNLVAITGDIHAFYASELQVDFDNPGEPMAVEYVTAGISSSPVQEIAETQVNGLDPDGNFGLKPLIPQFDKVLNDSNKHYKYNKSFAHGVAVMEIDGDKEVRVTFLDIQDVQAKTWDGKVTKTGFRTPSGSNRIETI
ncbi:MAG: alkaline phosphatase D family protein [Polyangiaceae bacterium]